MRISDIKAEYFPQTNPYEHISKCASICYHSNPKTEDNAKKFYDALVKAGHVSVLRHWSRYFIILPSDISYLDWYWNCPYVEMDNSHGNLCLVTNANLLFDDNGLAKRLEGQEVSPEEFKNICPELFRPSIHVMSSIDILREFNRVSPNNITEESTRYCDYSKDKFDNEITFGTSKGYDIHCISDNFYETPNVDSTFFLFKSAYVHAEQIYNTLRKRGVPPEMARKVLPLGTKSEAVYTYTIKEWSRILAKRMNNSTGRAHPDAIWLAQEIYKELQKLGYEMNSNNKLIYKGEETHEKS